MTISLATHPYHSEGLLEVGQAIDKGKDRGEQSWALYQVPGYGNGANLLIGKLEVDGGVDDSKHIVLKYDDLNGVVERSFSSGGFELGPIVEKDGRRWVKEEARLKVGEARERFSTFVSIAKQDALPSMKPNSAEEPNSAKD